VLLKTGLENITARIIAATVIQCTEIITRRKVTGTVSNHGETPFLMPLPNKVGLAAIKTTIQLGLFILSYTGFHFSYFFLSIFGSVQQIELTIRPLFGTL